MIGEANNERRSWGLPASAAVHALVAALVIFGLPITLPKPPQEEAVSVTIEPPPKPAEPAKAAPPPPAQPAKPPAQQQAAAPMLNPVVKFAEKDAGPRQSLAGAGAEDKPAEPTRPAPAEEPKATDAAPRTPDDGEKKPAAEAEGDEKEQADSKADQGAGVAALITTPSEARDKAAPPSPSKAQKAAQESEPKLQEARTLFSRASDGGATATTAMAGIPRGVRAGRLCATELRLQLVNGATPYFPDLLPSYELKEGTILKVRRSAFRARGAWHNLSFECQVDATATGVQSFAFHVGEPLSPEEARRRGLPSL